MDLAGLASAGSSLSRASGVVVLVLVCVWPVCSHAQSPSTDHLQIEKAKELLGAERWQEIVDLVESDPHPPAELYFYYGTALARLERWDDARRAFHAGARLEPFDKRFPLELAGVAFKQKRYPEAAGHLRHALELAPDDSYANDFLATVYLLLRNPEAALKYWNRIGKPQVAGIEMEPPPKVDSVLLDHAFAFSPADLLRLPDLLTSEARIRSLGTFSSFRFELLARSDGKFDVLFRNHERGGWGSSKLEALFSLFRSLPAETVNPEFFNLGHRAINLVSLYRWDAQKRRVNVRLSGPLGRQARRRYTVGGDWRNENWIIRTSFTGPDTELGSFNLRRTAVAGGLFSVVTGRWNWSAGAELSHREFRNVVPGIALTPSLLAEGFQLKQIMRVNADVWRIPERRVVLSADGSSEGGRIWSDPTHSFLKLQGALRFHWFPRAEGDDYEMQHRVSIGRTVGDVPFDELFVLGVLGDNPLLMRGHVTTRGGRKGSGPIGRNYFISNWDLEKNVLRKYGATLSIGPFIDIGKITDDSPVLGSQKWLVDTGIQVRVRVFGASILLSYGKDLRSGNNAVTARLE